MRYILTSASLGSSDEAQQRIKVFAADLTGMERSGRGFALISGKLDEKRGERAATPTESSALSEFDFVTLHKVYENVAPAEAALRRLFGSLGTNAPQGPLDEMTLRHLVHDWLRLFGPAALAANLISSRPQALNAIAQVIFPAGEALGKALESLLALMTFAREKELTQSLGSNEASLDALRIHRIKAEFERLEEQVEALDALVAELMNHPSVKQRIDKLVEDEASKQSSHKTTLQSDISRLRKERGEWEERIRKQREEHRKVRDETVKVVKAAFEKARAEGVSTFADLAVFQALSAPATVPLSAGTPFADRSASIAQPIVRDLTPSDQDVISTLRSLGVPAQRATAFAALGEAALKAGLMVSVRGIAARLAVEGWARAIGCAAVLFDSTIGLIDAGALTSVLTRVPTTDVLALLDANLSALDIYARPISDLVLARLARPDGEPRPAILLALADGVGSLPLPKTFEGLSVSLDLQRRYVFRSVPELDEMMSMATNPEDGTLYVQLWRPAADRLLTQIDRIEPEARALALSILVAQ